LFLQEKQTKKKKIQKTKVIIEKKQTWKLQRKKQQKNKNKQEA